VLKHGVVKVDEACGYALKHGISNADIIKQYLDGTIKQASPKEDLHCYNVALLETNYDLR
jgi:hypothetical protein